MRAVVLVLMLVATSARGDPATTDVPRNAIWIQNPAGIAWVALDRGVIVPLGVNFAGPRDTTIIVEGTFLRRRFGADRATTTQVWGALGVPFRVWGPDEMRGLFLAPKLFTAWAADDAVADELSNPPLSQAGQSFEFHAGGDLLLQWRFGQLYLATMLGATAGICVGCMEGVPNALYGPDLWTQGARGRDQFVGTLNFNLVRAGYVW